MASRWCTLALGAAVLLYAQASHAEPRVLVVETRDSPPLPGLAAQVQLHAGRPVTVGTIQQRDTTSMVFASRASAIVGQHDATIVVWVAASEAEATGQRTFLVFAAGRFPGRALLELVRFDASTPASEIERTVGLKIAGLFDTIVAPRPLAVTLGVTTEATAAWSIEVGGAGVVERGDRGLDARLAVAIDRRWPRGAWALAVRGSLHWQPGGTISSEPGVVSIDELGPGAAVGIERSLGAARWFARATLGVPLLFVAGTSTAGAHGSVLVISPTAGGELGTRWALSDTLELVVSLGADAAFTGQQFLVAGREAADLRHARGWLTLGLSLPLH